jgi:hypothetical protein
MLPDVAGEIGAPRLALGIYPMLPLRVGVEAPLQASGEAQMIC